MLLSSIGQIDAMYNDTMLTKRPRPTTLKTKCSVDGLNPF